MVVVVGEAVGFGGGAGARAGFLVLVVVEDGGEEGRVVAEQLFVDRPVG